MRCPRANSRPFSTRAIRPTTMNCSARAARKRTSPTCSETNRPMSMLSPIRREEAAKTAPAPAPSPRRWRRTLQIGLPLAILVAAGYGLTHREGPANAAPPMPVVTVAAPLVREITEWDDYVGRFEASRSVEVRPRVSGELTGIHFTDEIGRAHV